MDPRTRRPDVVVEADIAYEQMIEDHSRSKHGVGGTPYFDHEATTYNFYANLHGYLSLNVGDVTKGNSNHTVLQHKEMIDRCFLHDSVEQIMEALKQE
jgi:hypothetical protein